MNLVAKRRNKRDLECYEREETAMNGTMDKPGATVGGGRAGKEKKKCENFKCAQKHPFRKW